MKVTPFTFESLGQDALPANTAAQAGNQNDSVEQAPPPPTFSEDELAAAKQLAYDDGFAAGKKEGLREVDRDAQEAQAALTKVVTNISDELGKLEEGYNNSLNNLQSSLGKLVITCADKVVIEALRKDPISDIQAMVESCLDGLFDTPEIVAVVHDDIKPLLQGKLPASITIETDSSMALTDCKLNWKHGQATRNSDEIWQEIDSIVNRHFSKSPIETEKAESAPITEDTSQAESAETTEVTEAVEVAEELSQPESAAADSVPQDKIKEASITQEDHTEVEIEIDNTGEDNE